MAEQTNARPAGAPTPYAGRSCHCTPNPNERKRESSSISVATTAPVTPAVSPASATSASAVSTSAPTTASATPAVAPSPAASTTAAPTFAWFGDVDRKRAPVHRLIIKRRDGRLGLRFVGHFDESEPAATAGLPVGYHLSAGYRPVLLKHRVQVVGCCGPG